MKVRGGFLFGGKRGSFGFSPEALLFSFQGASIGSRAAERLARTPDRLLGSLRLLRCFSFGGGERFEAQALAHAMELGAREILGSFEPAFETRPLGLAAFPRACFGFGAPRSRSRESRLVARRLPFGNSELTSTPIDLFAPKRHERLERIALFHRRSSQAMPESNIAGRARPFRAR
jgi:hypothetical protein